MVLSLKPMSILPQREKFSHYIKLTHSNKNTHIRMYEHPKLQRATFPHTHNEPHPKWNTLFMSFYNNENNEKQD